MFNDSRFLVLASEHPWARCWHVAACSQRERRLREPTHCLSPMQMLAWPDLAKLLGSGSITAQGMQPRAMKTQGFAELAAYQHLSLMHE